MMESERDYIIAFSCLLKIGPARFNKLRAFFPTLRDAWLASTSELSKAGISDDVIAELLEQREGFDFNGLNKMMESQCISVVTIDDDGYPELLRAIHNPPFVLYYRGELPRGWGVAIGMVGTRKPTPYGRQVATGLARDLASGGVLVVSGLALGIDTLAHEGVLEVNRPTVAVIGSGVDEASIYPPQNRLLARRIVDMGGAVMSEYPPGSQARKQNFPARNRIIAGMSRGVAVIEAQEKSGALITAYSALDENRDVFAVPGPITSRASDGPNNLLKRGAIAVTSCEDILVHYDISVGTKNEGQSVVFEDDTEANIYGTLSNNPVHVDMIAGRLELDSATVTSTLLIMEMRGLVENVGNMQYVRKY